MGNADVLYFLLSICVIPSHLASAFKEGTPKLNERCLKETTVEGCETILLSWSYSNETNTCEKGFVCYGCDNRFDSHDECTTTCPMLPIPAVKPKPKPMLKRRNCRFWLMRGGSCQKIWFEFKKNKLGIMRRLLYYTGCRQEKNRLFEYDFYRKKCHEIKNRASEKIQEQQGKAGSNRLPGKGRRRKPTSSGASNDEPSTYEVADQSARAWA